MKEDYKNKDGTYNGAKMLSNLSGISEEEILEVFERMKYLMDVENKSQEETKEIIRKEFPTYRSN